MKLIKTIRTFAPAAALALGLAPFGSVGVAHADSHSDMAEHGTMHVTKKPNLRVLRRMGRPGPRRGLRHRSYGYT